MSLRMKTTACVLILLTVFVTGHCQDCDSLEPDWASKHCREGVCCRPDPNSSFESRWEIPLKSKHGRKVVIHLGPTLGFTPHNVTITSRARSHVSFNLSFVDDDDQVDKREKFLNGSVVWSSSRCDVPSPLDFGSDLVGGKMSLVYDHGSSDSAWGSSEKCEAANETGIGFYTIEGSGGTFVQTKSVQEICDYDDTHCWHYEGWTHDESDSLIGHNHLSSNVGTTLFLSIAASNMTEDVGDMSRARLEIRASARKVVGYPPKEEEPKDKESNYGSFSAGVALGLSVTVVIALAGAVALFCNKRRTEDLQSEPMGSDDIM